MPDTSLTPIKILVVDDLPEKLLVYRSILDELGEEVLTARSGEEALKQILAHDFAVILLDVNMPGMDGFETADMIRRRARCAHTPIIFITAFADEMHETRGYSLGAVDFILAPVNPDVLRTKVRVFVDLNRLTRQLRDQSAIQIANAESAKARLAVELENATDFIARADSNCIVRHMNDGGRRMLGMPPAARFPMSIAEFVTSEDRELLCNVGLPAAAREGAWFGELSLQSGDGPEVPVSLVVLAHRDEQSSTESYSIIARDITQRRQAETELAKHRTRLEDLVSERTSELEASLERLRLADRLASIGTLAAGLGHDMGNLLLPIRMRLDTLEQIPLPPDVREDLQAIKTAGEYLQRLCKGLRLFALDPDDDDYSQSTTDLKQWWPEVEPFLRNSLQKSIELKYECHSDVPPILIPPHRFTQIIYNLVQNANDALRGRSDGIVSIGASVKATGDQVIVHVTDNGAGMSAEVKRRCLEPFFTTKSRGISTGLGLALVHGAATKAGGSIGIESQIGCGTTFLITLPTVRESTDGLESRATGAWATAWIGLQSQHLNAYVSAILRSMRFHTQFGVWPPDPDATLLVLDGQTVPEAELEEFLADGADRFAIVIGADLLSSSSSSRRITCIEAKPSPSRLRAAIDESITRLAYSGSRMS